MVFSDPERRRYPGRRIIEVHAHNDLRGITAGVATLMKLKPMDLTPLGPLRSLWIVLQSRLHGLNSRLVPMLGGPAPTGLREDEQRRYRGGWDSRTRPVTLSEAKSLKGLRFFARLRRTQNDRPRREER